MNSVAMCTYNGEKHIREQLESIIGQTMPPDEIVICDDGSKDHTVDIIRDVLKDWKGKLQLVCNEKNLGFVKNFEKAISLCHGDIIYLSDQDDVWDLHKIEIMDEVFCRNPDVVTVWHDAELVDESLCRLYDSFWKTTLEFNEKKFLNGDYSHILEGNVMQGSACAFRKEVFCSAVPFPKHAFHDEWLLLVSLLTGRVIPVSKILMKYRQADNALGGMPVSIKAKFLHYWNFVSYKKIIIDKMKRRESVFGEILDRHIEVNYPDVLKQYERHHRFLQYRLSCIAHKDLRLISPFANYRRCSHTMWTAVKMVIKDYLCMMYK